MSKANYEPSYRLILGTEAGFWNDPKGGPTMNGVTQSTYDSWRKNNHLPVRDVRLIAADERESIYRDGYWNPIKGDELPTGLDYCVFDFAINSGPVQAAKDLQRVLNVNADGAIGPKTIEAARVAMANGGYELTIKTYIDRRWSFMQTLKNFPENKNGWKNRLDGLRLAALAMATHGPFDEAPATLALEPVGAVEPLTNTIPALPAPRSSPRDVRVLATTEGKGLALAFAGLFVAILPQAKFFSRDAALNDLIYNVYHAYGVFALVLGLCILAWQQFKKRTEKNL